MRVKPESAVNGKRQCRTVSFSVAALLFSFLLFFFLCFFSFAFLLLWIALASLCCSWLLIVTPQAPKSPPDRPPDHPQAAQDHPKTTPRPPFGPSWPLLRTTNLFCFFGGRFLLQLGWEPFWIIKIWISVVFCFMLRFASPCFVMFWFAVLRFALLCFASLIVAFFGLLLFAALCCFKVVKKLQICLASLCFAVLCYVLICCVSLCFASRCFFDFFHKKRSETATFREILGSNA